MISWIQRTFERHMKLVFILLLLVLIVPFITIIGNTPGLGQGRRSVRSKPFFDVNLNSQQGYAKVFGDASLSVELNYGIRISASEGRMQSFALSRYAKIHLADELGIGEPNKDELMKQVSSLGAFMGENREFDPKKYNEFRDSLKLRADVTEDDVGRVIVDDWRAQRAQELLSGPGYVLPTEVSSELRDSDTKWTVAVATIDETSFQPKITPTEEDLKATFEANTAAYRLPEQIGVDAIEFSHAAYASKVTLTDAEVRAYYDANPHLFPKPPTATPTPAPATPEASNPDADFALVRPQVEAALLRSRCAAAASEAAEDFAVRIFEAKAAAGSAQLEKLATDAGAKLSHIAPFAETEPPAELAHSPAAANAAFKLDNQRTISDPVRLPASYVVLVWREIVPPRDATLDDVRDKVAADFLRDARNREFQNLGARVRTALASKLASGASFTDAVKQVSAEEKVTIAATEPPAFTRSSPPKEFPSVIDAAARTTEGEISSLVTAGTKGYLVRVIKKEEPDTTNANPAYAQSLTRLQGASSGSLSASMLQELISDQTSSYSLGN